MEEAEQDFFDFIDKERRRAARESNIAKVRTPIQKKNEEFQAVLKFHYISIISSRATISA